jgi:disulfide bond formation protein DsbB
MMANLFARPSSAAAIVALAGAAALIGAWIFQYGFGLAPCPLCLEQRYAYYFAIPLAALLWLGASHGASRKVILLGFGAIALAMLWNAGLGVYHSGVEWKFWPGPSDCSGPLNELGGAGGLMKQLQTVRVVRCDDAAWRFLGLSLAGYNALISLGLAGAALLGLRAAKSQLRD